MRSRLAPKKSISLGSNVRRLALCSKLCERNCAAKACSLQTVFAPSVVFVSAIAVKAKQPDESVPTRVSLGSVRQYESCDQENNNETQSQTHYLCCACGDSPFCGARVRTSFQHWLVEGERVAFLQQFDCTGDCVAQCAWPNGSPQRVEFIRNAATATIRLQF